MLPHPCSGKWLLSWCIFFCFCIVILGVKNPYELHPITSSCQRSCSLCFFQQALCCWVGKWCASAIVPWDRADFLRQLIQASALTPKYYQNHCLSPQLMFLALRLRTEKVLKSKFQENIAYEGLISQTGHVSRLVLRDPFSARHFSVSCCFHFPSCSGEDTLAVQSAKSRARTSLSQERGCEGSLCPSWCVVPSPGVWDTCCARLQSPSPSTAGLHSSHVLQFGTGNPNLPLHGRTSSCD